ncbi:MAG: hypothetical protein KA967_05410 [Methanoculleus sp.]|nr:hypothetical protein [Methanoculleus sp.]
MDSTGIIQIFLVIMTVTMIAGFAGVLYYLSRIAQALAGLSHGGTIEPQERPADSRGSPAIRTARPPGDIDPRGVKSLEENLGAISRKYSLASFTLATADGLLVGSTRSGSEDEAARYSHLYARGERQDGTGAELLGIPYRGETLVGIARPKEHLSAELMNALEQDTRDALQRWV